MQKTTVLTLNKDYKRLYFRGKSTVDSALVTYAIKNRTPEQNRIGITVSKKVGKAVCRNRCKRIIRAAYREIENEIPNGWDFVFVARAKTASMKSTELSAVMRKQIKNLTTKTINTQQKKKSSEPKTK